MSLVMFIIPLSLGGVGNVGKCPFVTLEMETPSTPKPVTPKKPVHVGNVETSGDAWTDVREATKARSSYRLLYRV